jgi:hypothetical protein
LASGAPYIFGFIVRLLIFADKTGGQFVTRHTST